MLYWHFLYFRLEEKYNSLSGRSCEDGEMGKDGDCANICSKDHFLTYENKATRSGRVACCRDGEKVSPSGGCQKDEIPDFCSRLKGRLVDVPNPPSVNGVQLQAGQYIFLRGFEAEVNGNMVRCDNDCCCSSFIPFFPCGLAFEESQGTWNSILGLRDSCFVFRVYGFKFLHPLWPWYDFFNRYLEQHT